MLYWIPYAFVRIVVFFIAGILTGIYAENLIPFFWAVPAFLVLVFLYVAVCIFNARRRKVIVNPGLIALLAVFLAGYLNVLVNTESRKASHLFHFGGITHVKGTITGFPQEGETFRKQVLHVEAVKTSSGWAPAVGKVQLFLRRDVFPDAYNYGDVLLVGSVPMEIQGPGNPREFDFRRFMRFKNITHQAFPAEGKVFVTGNRESNRFMAGAYKVREWAKETLLNAVSGKQEQAIACALVLGVTDGLDNELMQAYSASGAMHVLAVSGLHVGILYLIISWCLLPLKRLPHGMWIISGISLLVLWGYAAVTGLSPSVLRAVTMFSFMALARPLHHRTNIYNTLAVSAFCILLYDPFLLMSAGFQLSYIAVVGIVYLHPLLYNWFEPEARWADELWKITSVSLAAQITTFALGLFYFHQFPTWFWLSNFFVIPLGFGILTGGLAVLAVSFSEVLLSFSGLLLTWMIKAMNFGIFTVEQLPMAVAGNIYISAFQCALLMASVVTATLFFEYRKLSYLYATAVLLLFFTLDSWRHQRDHYREPVLTVYKVPGHGAFDLVDNGRAYVSYDSGLHEGGEKTRFHIQPNHVFRRVSSWQRLEDQSFARTFPCGMVMRFNGKTILRLDSIPGAVAKPIVADYLIVSPGAALDPAQVLRCVVPGKVILDTSAPFRVANKAREEYLNRKIPVHSVWHEGAFTITL